MRFERFAVAAAFSAITALAWSSEASAASVETYRLSNVTQDWQSIGLSTAAQGGVLLAQTISEIGWDAGTTRINDSFQLRYQESDDDTHALAEEAAVVSVIGSLGDLGVTGESGTFWMSTTDRNTTHKIEFSRTYTHPVVLVQAVSALGDDPVAVVPYVTTGDFALIGMPEGANYDGVHYANEKVQYVVIEAGTYMLHGGDNGTAQYLEAGLKEVTTSNYSNTGMTDITPSSVALWDSTTALIAEPQSAAAATYRGTRMQRTVDSDGIITSVSVRHMLDKTVEHPTTGTAPTTTAYIGYIAVGTGFPKITLTATANPISATEITTGVTNSLSAPTTTTEGTVIPNCTVADVEEKLIKSSDSWGGNRFGSSYDLMAGIGSEESTGHDFWMGAEASSDMTVLNKSGEVFSAGAVSYADDGTSGSRGWIDVLGVNLWSSPLTGSVTKEYSRTFLEGSGDFYGFSVGAEAVGNVGITGTLSISGSTISATGTPYANIQATATAGLGDDDIAFGGVEGTLNLLEISVPVTGTFTLATTSYPYYTWSYGASWDLTSLDGELDLVAKVAGEELYSYELFSWNGLSLYHDNLMSGSGCL